VPEGARLRERLSYANVMATIAVHQRRSAILAGVPALKLVTAAERPELVEEMRRLGASPWPEFLQHDAVVESLWRYLYELAADYQLGLLDEATDSLAAIGNCIPIRWDGDPRKLPDRGIDAVLEDGVACLREGASPTAASALMIVVSPELLGRGISGRAIEAMAEVVGRHGLSEFVAPVRPTDKHRYPLIPIERYIGWRRDDGLPFDPWIRVHARVGGEVLRPASAAMRVRGSVADWEGWTGMALPQSGSYVVRDALVPVEIDRERDVGEYLEPACWMRHRVEAR
jgi:GNAT superfamily N-acetyltransferase